VLCRLLRGPREAAPVRRVILIDRTRPIKQPCTIASYGSERSRCHRDQNRAAWRVGHSQTLLQSSIADLAQLPPTAALRPTPTFWEMPRLPKLDIIYKDGSCSLTP